MKDNQLYLITLLQYVKSIESFINQIYLFKLIKMISDELQECKSSFKGQKQPYQVKFFLQTNDDTTNLIIELKNRHDPSFYRTSINQQYIKNKADLSFCFQSPEDLFYTLMQLFDEVTIGQDGTISFEMKLNATKLKRKLIKIQMQKCEFEENEIMKLKLEKLRKQFRNDSMAKQQKIKELVKSNKQYAQTISILQQEVTEIKKDQQMLYLENKRQEFKINSMVKQNQLQRQQMAVLKKNLQYFLVKLNTLEIYSFFQNPHWHYFSVVKTQTSFRIIRKDCDSVWCAFVFNTPLKSGKINGFRIKQVKTCFRNIMFGIGSSDIFGISNSYKQKNSIAYNAYSGNVWENGASRKSGSTIYDSQIVTMDVNLATFRISWSVDGKKVGEALITESLRNKQLYLVLQFYNVQDEVELMLF